MIPEIEELPKSDIELIEEAFVARLNKAIPFIKTEQFPLNFEDYNVETEYGCMLIRYVTSTFEKLENGLFKAVHTFEIITVVRSVLESNGVYRILRATQKSLSSLAIPELVNSVIPVNQQLLKKDSDVWVYTTDYSIESISRFLRS